MLGFFFDFGDKAVFGSISVMNHIDIDNVGNQQGGPVRLDSMWQHRLTRPFHVQHTYYSVIYKQNPFNIISRGVQR